MAISGAIFDFDGTLMDSMGVWSNIGSRYLSSLGLKEEEGLEEELEETLYVMGLKEGAAYIRDRFQLNQSAEEVMIGVKKIIFHCYSEEIQPKPGAMEFLKKLQQNGIPMAIATAGDRILVEAALKRLGLLHTFFMPERIVTCTEAGASKDVPIIYHMARASMGTQLEETWVFEDAFHGANTAKQAGYPVAGVFDVSGKNWIKELKQACSVFKNSFEEYRLEDFL